MTTNNTGFHLPKYYSNIASAIELRKHPSTGFYNGFRFIAPMFLNVKENNSLICDGISYMYSVAAQNNTTSPVRYAKKDKCSCCSRFFDFATPHDHERIMIPVVRNCCNEYVICYDCAIVIWKECNELYCCPECNIRDEDPAENGRQYNWKCMYLLPIPMTPKQKRASAARAVREERLTSELQRYKDKYKRVKITLHIREQQHEALKEIFKRMEEMANSIDLESPAFPTVSTPLYSNNNNNNMF